MKKQLPFIFTFVFLVAFSFVWPKICFVGSISTVGEGAIKQYVQTEGPQQQAIGNLFVNANEFYGQLEKLDSLGIFAAFYQDGKFNIALVVSDNEDAINESTNLFISAKNEVETFCEENPTELFYNTLLADDDTKQLLNQLYSHILTICELN